MSETITIKELERMSYNEIIDVLKNDWKNIEQEYYCYYNGDNVLLGTGYGEFAFTSVVCKYNEKKRVAEQLKEQGYNVNSNKIIFN